MLIPVVLFFGTLQTAAAQKWMHKGCDDPELITDAWSDAVNIARTAVDVLDKKRNDEDVQSIVSKILGSGEGLEGRLEVAKSFVQNVALFDIEPSTAVSGSRDLIIYCKHHHERKGERLYNPDTGNFVSLASQHHVENCFENGPDFNPGTVPSAIMEYPVNIDGISLQAAIDSWRAAGSPSPAPDASQYAVEVDKPSTLNLCTWWLSHIEVGDTIMDRLEPGYLSFLSSSRYEFATDEPKDMPKIDIASNTLPGTLLHELTHSYMAGLSVDEPEDACYGWKCVIQARNPRNADTISFLAMSLWALSLEVHLDDDGNFHRSGDSTPGSDSEGSISDSDI